MSFERSGFSDTCSSLESGDQDSCLKSAHLRIYAGIPNIVTCNQRWVSEEDIATMEKPCDFLSDTDEGEAPDVSMEPFGVPEYLSSTYSDIRCLRIEGAGEIESEHWQSDECPKLCEKCDKFGEDDMGSSGLQGRKCTCENSEDGVAMETALGYCGDRSYPDRSITQDKAMSVKGLAVVYQAGTSQSPLCMVELGEISKRLSEIRPLMMRQGPPGADWVWKVEVTNSGHIHPADLADLTPEMIFTILEGSYSWCLGQVKEKSALRIMSLAVKEEPVDIVGLDDPTETMVTQTNDGNPPDNWAHRDRSPPPSSNMLQKSTPPRNRNSMIQTSPPRIDNSMMLQKSPLSKTGKSVLRRSPLPRNDDSMMLQRSPLPRNKNSMMLQKSSPPRPDNSMMLQKSPLPRNDESMMLQSTPIVNDQSSDIQLIKKNPSEPKRTSSHSSKPLNSYSCRNESGSKSGHEKMLKVRAAKNCDEESLGIGFIHHTYSRYPPFQKSTEISNGLTRNGPGSENAVRSVYDRRPNSPDDLNLDVEPKLQNYGKPPWFRRRKRAGSCLDRNRSASEKRNRSAYNERPDNFTVLKRMIHSVNDNNPVSLSINDERLDSDGHKDSSHRHKDLAYRITLVSESVEDNSSSPPDLELACVVQELDMYSSMIHNQEPGVIQPSCISTGTKQLSEELPGLVFGSNYCPGKGLSETTCGMHQQSESDKYDGTGKRYCESGPSRDSADSVNGDGSSLDHYDSDDEEWQELEENTCSVCGEPERKHSWNGTCPLFYRRVTRRMSQSLDLMNSLTENQIFGSSHFTKRTPLHTWKDRQKVAVHRRQQRQKSPRLCRTANTREGKEQHQISGIPTEPVCKTEVNEEWASSESPGEQSSFKCKICDLVFTTSSQICAHVKDHTKTHPYVCQICFKCFTKVPLLSQHMKTHSQSKRFQCELCKKRYAWNCSLKEHMRVHTGERPYSCSFCGKQFTRYKNLTQHTLFHTREKRYQCSECYKIFTWKQNLQRHLLSHTGEKAFPCHICARRFAQRDGLNSHIQSVHRGGKARPHQCQLCEKRFIKTSHLRDHMQTHVPHSEKIIYRCNKCDKSYRWPYDLKRHKCKIEETPKE